MCKKCKKAFRKDMANYEESDEYCPHCDNHYVRVPVSCITCCYHAAYGPAIQSPLDPDFRRFKGYRGKDAAGCTRCGG